jgi:uncharacterized protein (UPF0371 family)
VNVAYESATADLRDFNQIDPFHLEAYRQVSVNYNRDVEIFPVLKRILEKITGGESFYKSPTDMGVNRAGFGIIDDAVCSEAAKQEVIRRYLRHACEYAAGLTDKETAQRAELIMKELGLQPELRKVIQPAREAAADAQRSNKGDKGVFCGAAMELKDGSLITGKNSSMMHAASSLVLNAIKHLANIPDKIHLLSPAITASIGHFKKEIYNLDKMSLDLEEALIALSISATTNPAAEAAMLKLKDLRGCEAHMTHMPTPGDEVGFRKLGVNLTSDPNFSTKDLFIA